MMDGYELIQMVKDLKRTFPERESDEFDMGYAYAIEEVLQILYKSKNK